MTEKFKKIFNTLVILYLLILPHSIYTIIDRKYNPIYFMTLLVVALLLFINQSKLVTKTIYKAEFQFVIILCVFSLLTSWFHGIMSPGMSIIGPLVTYIGYFFIRNNSVNFNLKIFDFVFIFFYVYFYFIYFSILPDLFNRPDFDEDEVVFEIASSNGISIALNITLYSYLILNYLLGQKKERNIVIISIINFVFIFIQQSRAGVAVSLILLLMSLYEYFGSQIKKYLLYLGIPALIFIYLFYDFIINYLTIIGGVSGVETYTTNERESAAVDFFNGLNKNNFIFGYGNDKTFYEFTYTFNVFLDFWSRYSLLGLFILIFIFIRRFILWRNYKFPLYYFLPFFFYAFVESWFFPEYWDVIIYLIIFVKCDRLTDDYSGKIVSSTNHLYK